MVVIRVVQAMTTPTATPTAASPGTTPPRAAPLCPSCLDRSSWTWLSPQLEAYTTRYAHSLLHCTALLCLLTLFNSLPIVYVSTYLVIADLLFFPPSLPQSLPPSFPRICHCPVPLSLSSSFTPYLPPDPTHNTHITHRAGRISDTGSTHPSHGKNRAVTGAWGTCVPWLCGRCNML